MATSFYLIKSKKRNKKSMKFSIWMCSNWITKTTFSWINLLRGIVQICYILTQTHKNKFKCPCTLAVSKTDVVQLICLVICPWWNTQIVTMKIQPLQWMQHLDDNCYWRRFQPPWYDDILLLLEYILQKEYLVCLLQM